ncbi:class I SAM-dependent methyltransferase [Methylobacterium oryzihabitans]|uniref:Methyltransferase domain-containing protein n=1 Tax=Methylobacterium oryzihabitans TaxID=2499852 RepID=A0A437NT87_9HYPH|nr:methyltransferase domain-containing protein [Methylobacterium oryzihabitans]RVU13243.1 methyltransferase domain-containing protein [Methylobacterium oryzihabitans]
MPEEIPQSEYWNGEVGVRWARMQAELDAVFAPLTAAFLDGLDLPPGGRVLDVGCGCGETALIAAGRVGAGGDVLGVDISQPMLDRARERARAVPPGHAALSFLEADAQTHPFAPDRDVVLSRFGTMFFDDTAAAFANLARALRPGGRLALLCWRGLPENPWVARAREAVLTVVPEPATPTPGGPGPFRFADIEALEQVLRRLGFADVATARVDRMLTLGRDAADATRFAVTVGPVSGLLRDLDAPMRERAAAAVTAALPQTGPVRLAAGCWRVTARRPD